MNRNWQFLLALIFGMLLGEPIARASNDECSTEETDVSSLQECVAKMRTKLENRDSALERSWNVLIDPEAALVSFVNFSEVEAAAEGEDLLPDLVASQWWNLALDVLGPNYPKVRADVGNYLSDLERFKVVGPRLRTLAISAMRAAFVSSSAQSLLEQSRPVLEKPLDSLLAIQGMEWMYDHRCHLQDDSKEQECLTSSFPKDFESYYGVDISRNRVWVMGFLLRREKNRRGLAELWQRELLTGLAELSAQN